MKTISSIGAGGFGRVEKVMLDNGEIVAKKIFDPSPSIRLDKNIDLDKLRKRFIREFNVQKELSSQYIMPVYDSNLEIDEPWFTMPLAEKNFSEQIAFDRKNGQISTTALADILNGLEYLHELGYIHRDLKPDNILYYNGSWRVTDFGLVSLPSNNTTQLTSVNSAWGSQYYCAPEQAQDFKRVNLQVDIYSFGCILHDYFKTHMRVPFAKQTCPGEFGIIVEKCTEDKLNRRFSQVADLREALFQVMSTNELHISGEEAIAWIEQVENLKKGIIWDVNRFNNFVKFLRVDADEFEKERLYYSLDENCLVQLKQIDELTWKELGEYFFENSKNASFGFNYCDLLIKKLLVFYNNGDVEMKALATIAGAVMGSTHNRWFVMEKVLKMAGVGIDHNLAQRILIEIKISKAEKHFVWCAECMQKELDIYQSEIAQMLKKFIS